MIDNLFRAEELLPPLLDAAVSIWQMRLKESGPITDETWENVRASLEQFMEPGGEDLLFRTKATKKGHTAHLFNDLAYALAVMSFAPGGVKLFGCHWEAIESAQ